MALDPTIILGGQAPPPAPNPIAQLGQIEDVRAQIAQRQAAAQSALSIAQQRIDAAKMKATINVAVAAAGGDVPTAIQALRANGANDAADAAETNYGAAQKATSDALKSSLDAKTTAFDVGGRLIDGLDANPTTANLLTTKKALHGLMDSDPRVAAVLDAQLPDDTPPDQIQARTQAMRALFQPQKEYLDAQVKLHDGWNTPERMKLFANALALAPDQSVPNPKGGGLLGKADLITLAQHQGLDPIQANAALALVQGGATPDEIRAKLSNEPLVKVAPGDTLLQPGTNTPVYTSTAASTGAEDDSKYEAIVQKMALKQPVTAEDRAFAQAYERRKTLGVDVSAGAANTRLANQQDFTMQEAGRKNIQTLEQGYLDAREKSDTLHNVIDAAKNGNMQAASVQSLLGTLGLVTAEGVKRINTTELESVQGAGSLLERIKSQVGGLTAGQKLSPKLQQDLGELSDMLTKSAYGKYSDSFDRTAQRYKLTGEPKLPPPSTGGSGAAVVPVPSNVRAALASAKSGMVHTLSDGSRWLKAADGSISKAP